MITRTSVLHNSRGATAIVQWIDGELFVDLTAFTSTFQWDRMRLQFLLAMIKRNARNLANFEMIINVHDCPMRGIDITETPVFGITRCKGTNVIPLPQWYRQRDGKWQDWITKNNIRNGTNKGKSNKAVFRGAFRPSVLQYKDDQLQFINITEDNWSNVGRTRLLYLQQQDPSLYDIGLFTSSSDQYRFITKNIKRNHANKSSMMEQVDHFKYVIHVEGACGWADRLKTLLSLDAVVLFQEPVCQEFWYPLLRQWTHYIPVDNLLTNMTDYLKSPIDDQEYEFIISNVVSFKNHYLTTDAWEYYMKQLLIKYSRIWGSRPVERRPGSKRFLQEAKCKSYQHNECDDSDAYED